MAAATGSSRRREDHPAAPQPAQRSLRVHTPRWRDVRDKHEEDLPINDAPCFRVAGGEPWPGCAAAPAAAARSSPSQDQIPLSQVSTVPGNCLAR